jgi:hypothetical protein
MALLKNNYWFYSVEYAVSVNNNEDSKSNDGSDLNFDIYNSSSFNSIEDCVFDIENCDLQEKLNGVDYIKCITIVYTGNIKNIKKYDDTIKIDFKLKEVITESATYKLSLENVSNY